MVTPSTSTTLPEVEGERTVIGTYRWAPLAASSRSRYAPGCQPVVETVRLGRHGAVTIRVGRLIRARR